MSGPKTGGYLPEVTQLSSSSPQAEARIQNHLLLESRTELGTSGSLGGCLAEA